ncbi:hypothetical protein KBB27_00245 [Patescibacteria group bacterium]|nr:hypothetical protein [Patescibacteria group bacterium]
MYTPRYPNMKPYVLPRWLKVGCWIGFGGFSLVILFFLFSGFLPVFGSLIIEEGGRSQAYSHYDVWCVYDRGDVALSFRDQTNNKERVIDVKNGYMMGIGHTETNNVVALDGSPIKRESCTRYQTSITGHGSSKSLKVFEYRLLLDCQTEKEHLLADLHGYNCWRK